MSNKLEIGNMLNNELELYYADGGDFIGYLNLDNIKKHLEKRKIILIRCKFCNRDFGVEEYLFKQHKTFKVNCPYCKKENIKESFGRFLDLVRSL